MTKKKEKKGLSQVVDRKRAKPCETKLKIFSLHVPYLCTATTASRSPRALQRTEQRKMQLQIRSFFFISAMFTLFGDFHSVTSSWSTTPVLALDGFSSSILNPTRLSPREVS
ncbi:hypothetical protein ASPVEDRAFT_551456 [Aspergillus versicolor CBS 583.65]|uniref:Transmembrane protein n=1 Tax=Aspergillus versicolor CBS 583.65 TaxID=1036611 RepID=A0A1L9PFG6_ASPVE|nr:uncharacterized protein ASPVEDRAFT_551456 [Aspergillus versicolor CBS 583.65]OJJ00186.1 hypothetical protein ASPVEDRAFT_551456 [Aspergillus versicolor CBS 583.65]